MEMIGYGGGGSPELWYKLRACICWLSCCWACGPFCGTTGRWFEFDTGEVPRAGLCDGRVTGRVGGVAGDIRLNNCCSVAGTGGGVDGVDEHRGRGSGGASLSADGQGDGEY